MGYISLLSYSSRRWSQQDGNLKQRLGKHFSQISTVIDTTSHQTTSTLTLLSAAVEHGLPLPPYFHSPPHLDLSSRWDILSKELAAEQPVDEAAYTALAVIQVISNLISDDLCCLVRDIRELVGEVDFSSVPIYASDIVSSQNGKVV